MIIEFVYLGQCQVAESDLKDFWAAVIDLAVNGIIEGQIAESFIDEPFATNTMEQNIKQENELTPLIFNGRNIVKEWGDWSPV